MLTVDGLIAVAKHYWFSDSKWDNSTNLSPETIRFHQRWRESLKEKPRWGEFLAELRRELPNYTVGSYMAACDGSWRCVVYNHGELEKPKFRYVLAGSMSILAPVYVVYGVEYGYDGSDFDKARVYFEPLPPTMVEPAVVIARGLESHFRVTKLPQEIWETPVGVYCNERGPSDTTLFHTLFSSRPEALP